ncbi:hypothetical protein CCZ01_04435 [Helicobacter monodelphidis]|uniref:ABC transporter permease n=1 Tax=Helicobacter sp. 15-1451 TaxID=2004995 RepID=UPI000DCBAD7B|nr:ABC transporter permease [Helicobacter sp. 15-1451]RAX57881.1 hypothetical protein CCZ01_04435 [Helicobacter sp. 15-1451]
MTKSIVNFLVRRYLRFDKNQPFISITAILAFLGVAVGVMVLIVAMAIMNGFDKEFKRKLFTMNYPLTIYPSLYLGVSESLLKQLEQNFPHLKFSPYLRSQAISKVGNFMEGAVVFGVDFERERHLNSVIDNALKEGEKQGRIMENTFDILVGKGLARNFELEIDSSLMLIFTHLQPNGLNFTPTMKRFKIRNFFDSGLNAYDKGYVFTNIEALRLVKKTPQGLYDGVRIQTNDAMQDKQKIQEFLPEGYRVIGWWEQNGNFFAAIELEKHALFIVLMLIILIASLNIITSLLMTVMNRRKEIALLLTLGATKKEIRSAFFRVGALIGISGIMLGLILAAILLWILANFPIISLPADVYGSTNLPLDLSMSDFLMILFGSIAVVLFSSFYPAKKATEVDPLIVLRNE